jgi:hypothetical protein
MYKLKCAAVLKAKEVRNDAQGQYANIPKTKCAKMPKAKCAKVLKEKCAKMRVRVRRGYPSSLVRRPEGKDKLTMCFEYE